MDGIEALEPQRPTVAEMLEAMPEGVQIAPSIDLDSQDPSFDDERGRRRCIALTRAGERCPTNPPLDSLLCSAHAGLMDAAKGGNARAQKLRNTRENAETLLTLRRLGTRALVAQTLIEEAEHVRATVQHLVRRAGKGDLDSARAVIPWINQALGNPVERVEHSTPGSLADLEAMDTAALEALVAEGRRARLSAVPVPMRASEPSEHGPHVG